MTTPLPPSPDARAAARWRAVAFALAGVSAFLSGLLLLTLKVDAISNAADAGAHDAAAAAEEDAGVAEKRGRIEGVVMLTGTPPEMKVPARRKAAAFCKTKLLASNAIRVKDGRLGDVLVRIENGGVKGDYTPPDEHVALEEGDCAIEPRMAGAMIGQTLDLKNRDPVLHAVHIAVQNEDFLKKSLTAGSAPVEKLLDTPGILKVGCDIHPWERSFLIVSDHPYFAVTDEDGAFTIPDVPAGHYTVEAWHARYGLRRFPVDVGEKTAKVTFTYESTDLEPDINKGELDGQF